MDAFTFRFFMSLAANQNLEMRLIDIFTEYLYGSLETDIYIRIPDIFKMSKPLSFKPKELCTIKLQSMWYNNLSDYLTKEGYTNDLICPCVS